MLLAGARRRYRPTSAGGSDACQRNQDAGTITYISGYGYSASAGQLDVFLAKELGYFDDLCLDVEINASGANGQQLVASGQAQFTALGSASDVMLAAANSKNLTAVATYGTTRRSRSSATRSSPISPTSKAARWGTSSTSRPSPRPCSMRPGSTSRRSRW